MFGSQFEPSSGIFGSQGADVGRMSQSEVVTNPGSDENVVDAGEFFDAFEEAELFTMSGFEAGTLTRKKAGGALTAFRPAELANRGIHVRSGTPDVGDGDGFSAFLGEVFGFLHQ